MGPLAGIKIVEFAGLGPGPFCGMVLADLGAEVLVIERKGAASAGKEPTFFNLGRFNVLNRGKQSIALDLKQPDGVATALRLIEGADALIEGFRPSVMERLGLGPELCLARNPRLVYGRMTGWGQSGPLAPTAGHDINYLAISGALSQGARGDGAPWAPPTLLGDMGAGALMLALGILASILEARQSGQGQVVDCAIADGASLLTALIYGLKGAGLWSAAPGANVLDSSAPFYDTYRCADGKWVTVGAIEPQFYTLLLEKCGIVDDEFRGQFDQARWPSLKEKLARLFASRSRDEWCALLEGSDACFAPVLDLDEAPGHPHNVARRTFLDIDGITQPAPAPRFGRTAAEIKGPPPAVGADGKTALTAWGFSNHEIDALRASGVVA